MSKGTINKVIIIGNLGQDPEFRQTQGGSLANLSIATTSTWKDQQGQFQDHTEWHRVTVFGRTAETARDYLRKGSKVYIEGGLRTRKWQDKNTGQDRYATEIFVSEFQMLDRNDGQRGQQQGGQSGGYPQSGPAPQNQGDGRQGSYAPPPPPPPPTGGMGDFDDDIPF